MAVTSVARNLEHWLNQLKSHISAGTPILESFPTISIAVGYIASAESIRVTARSAALSNSARRALWLKTWHGGTQKLGYAESIFRRSPFRAKQRINFGPRSRWKKYFPVRKKTNDETVFSPPEKFVTSIGEERKSGGFRKQEEKGVLFRTPVQSEKSH